MNDDNKLWGIVWILCLSAGAVPAYWLYDVALKEMELLPAMGITFGIEFLAIAAGFALFALWENEHSDARFFVFAPILGLFLASVMNGGALLKWEHQVNNQIGFFAVFILSRLFVALIPALPFIIYLGCLFEKGARKSVNPVKETLGDDDSLRP